MQYFFYTLVFFFGAALGSFVMVVADRFGTGEPFSKGRSKCLSCGKEIRNKDLIPIFSFLFLRGRCRDCQSKIPLSAPTIEIVMGTLSLLTFLKTGLSPDFLIISFIFADILLISVYDFRHFIIPDSFLIFFLIFAFLHNLLFIIHDSFFYSLLSLAGSGIALTAPFLLIFLISRGTWFGFGDVKYIAVIGFFLGLGQGASAVIVAFWAGAVFSILALLIQKIKPQICLPLFPRNLTIKSEVPFGPFLSLGILASYFLNVHLFQIQFLFG